MFYDGNKNEKKEKFHKPLFQLLKSELAYSELYFEFCALVFEAKGLVSSVVTDFPSLANLSHLISHLLTSHSVVASLNIKLQHAWSVCARIHQTFLRYP